MTAPFRVLSHDANRGEGRRAQMREEGLGWVDRIAAGASSKLREPRAQFTHLTYADCEGKTIGSTD